MKKRSIAQIKQSRLKKRMALQRRLGNAQFQQVQYLVRGPELKYVDIPNASLNIPIVATGNTPILLNGMRVGANNWNRVGNRIALNSFRIRGSINFAVTTNIANMDIRMLIVYDRNPNRVNPTLGDVIQGQSQSGATATTMMGSANPNNRDRFIILRDKHWNTPFYTFTAGVLTNCETTDIDFRVDEYIKIKKLPTVFAGDTGAIGDITVGALYLFIFETTANQFALTYETRLTFKEN